MKNTTLLSIVFLIAMTAQAQTFTNGNIATLMLSASANNTTASIVELNPTASGQSPANTYAINGTSGSTSLRFSGSAGTTCYLANSNDGSLLAITGLNSTTSSGNSNTITARGVGTLNASYSFSLAATYTGISGNQARCATSLNNTTWYIGDQGGIYSNGTTAPSPADNILSVKSFGGVVYDLIKANGIGTVSAPTGGTITTVPGVSTIGGGNDADFYLVSSGSNGSTFDMLYVVEDSSATAGRIDKYSLVSGSWVANGFYHTNFGGCRIAATPGGGGAYLFVSSGDGTVSGNKIMKLADAAGFNASININTANNITLYTAPTGSTLKGIAFAPTCATPPQPGLFLTKATFVYLGQTGVSYSVPNSVGSTYTWTYSGTGATINGSGNSVSIDYSNSATSGTLSVAAVNGCGAGPARTLAIVLNTPITVPTVNYDYSFVTVGCNRIDYLDTTFSTGDPDYACGTSTANVYQLKRLFTEISHLNPLPKYLFMTGDIVMGYINDTVALAKQLNGWRAIYESHPLSTMGITLVAIPGNHETEDKANGKKSYVAAERTFVRIMSPYIRGSNGPGVGGPDGLATDQSKLTYSFNNGSDHFIVIDTDPVGQDGITPYKWIASDIQAARANHARHIFAFGHKPAYSSPVTPQGGLDAAATLSQRDSLWKYLEANNCEAMFSAHEHLWDSIHPHAGKTWQVINGDGGTRVEVPWVGPGKQYYGYTIVNLYTNRTVNVMGLGRNTAMSTTVGTAYPINEDANPTTVRNNFNICLTTTSAQTIAACNSYTWHGTAYQTTGIYTHTSTNAAGCDSVETLNLTINTPTTASITPGSTTTFCAGDSVILTANAGMTSYSWSTGRTTSSITVKSSGNYTVSIIDANGCSSVSTPVSVTVNKLVSDFNGDGITDISDFQIFLGVYGSACSCPEDLNQDGTVDIGDFAIFVGQFDQVCH